MTEIISREAVGLTALKRTSWGAIFAGTMIALMVSLMLGLLGVALGIGRIGAQEQITGVGAGTIAWWMITTILGLLAGGCVAGRLSGAARKMDAMLHGVITWTIATSIMLVVATSAFGAVVAGGTNFVAGGISMAGERYAGSEIREPAGALPGQNPPEAAGAVSRRAGQTALWGFIALLIGGAAAAFGGVLGMPKELIVRQQPPAAAV